MSVDNKKKYLVYGLGITGQALIQFFLERGERIIGFEEQSELNYQKVKTSLKGPKQEIYFKDLPDSILDEVKEVLLSPGVPLTRPWLQEAKKRNIPVTGELEFASRFLKGSLLVVTGTNGKSTTVSLLQEILKAGGLKSSLKGNIGSPLITAVTEPPCDFYVIEASSYQLETIDQLHPLISIVLNVTEDHLDRYSTMEEYTMAKARISMNQTSADYFIYNADDASCLRMARLTKAKSLPFSLVNNFKEGAYVDCDQMIINLPHRLDRYSLHAVSLHGMHHQENMLAAIMAATLVGVDQKIISEVLRYFKGLPHRLTKVGSYKGVDFYDDSKATNVGAVVMSLASFEKNVILILGGRDKGGEYAPLKSLVQHKVKALVLLGEAQEKIAQFFDDYQPISKVGSMEEAVRTCYQLAEPGDIVLLAPACSSFDMYNNYAERGDDFLKWVQTYAS